MIRHYLREDRPVLLPVSVPWATYLALGVIAGVLWLAVMALG